MDISKITGCPVHGANWEDIMNINKVTEHDNTKEDTWYDEEARSQIYNEHAEKIYSRYLDNALAFICNHEIDGQDPDERFMRCLENYVDVPEQHADDFRRSVCVKWADVLKRTGYKQRWHEDGAMYQAIKEYMKNEHLGYPQFWDGQEVVFKSNVCLAYYQEEEEEERGRIVKPGEYGRIAFSIPRSTCWYYGVAVASVDGGTVVLEAPYSVLEDRMTYEEAAQDFQKHNNVCTCSIDTLMTSGCKCGHLEKK